MLKMCVKKQNLILINLAIAVIIISTFLCLFNEFNKEKSPSKVKACIIVLLRNQDLNSFIKTITNFELNFNQKYQYPYILLNNEDFTLHFKKQIIKYSNSTIEFGLIPSEHWSIPKWIDRQRVKKSLDSIGFSVEYRKMCRFFSGFFFKQNLTLKYDYFMRLDSHVKFPCSITSDPFVQLSNSNKQYGFILANKETRATIPTLWPTIKKWFNKPKFNIYRKGLRFISNDNGQTLSESNCIFYNNFEIGAFSLFRNESYTSYFNYLDKTGGFFYERWGDAPVHTYYILSTLKMEQIHRFKEIGYTHYIYSNIPKDNQSCKGYSLNKELLKPDQCITNWDRLERRYN